MHRALFSCILIAILIAPSIYMQRQYIGDYLQSPSDEDFLRLNSTTKRLSSILAPPGEQAVMLHFVDPNCPCNWLAKKHIQEIHSANNKNLKILTITPATAPGLSIPASPALAIINKDGSLRYFGVYGFGAFCSQDAKGVLDQVLSDMQLNIDSPPVVNTLGEGCYCRWAKD